jgi:hypothetical protein
VQFPREVTDNPVSVLDQRFRDDYVVMVAQGYLQDGDVTGALERLRWLEVDNVPLLVQDTAERFITTSREVADIRRLVALAEGLGRITPIMEAYRPLPTPSS